MSDCLSAPQGVYPPEPDPPAVGAPITDAFVVALKAWGNRVMGIATVDRILWHGERKCVRKLQEAGQIR